MRMIQINIKKLYSVLEFINEHQFSKNNKIYCIYNFLKWQIISRIGKPTKKYKWINEVNILVKKGDTGFTGNIYVGLHEIREMAFVLHAVKKNHTFIDIGANVGSYTLLASGVNGAMSYSFEPIYETFIKLRRNIKINKLSNRVRLHNFGLGSKKCELFFTNKLDTINHVILEATENSDLIYVNKLDSQIKLSMPTIMKIDVEGYETQVLRGATEVLNSEFLYGVIIEINGSGKTYGYNDNEIFDVLFGYNFFPIDYDPIEKKVLRINRENIVQGNVIFIKDMNFIKGLVYETKPIKILNKVI